MVLSLVRLIRVRLVLVNLNPIHDTYTHTEFIYFLEVKSDRLKQNYSLYSHFVSLCAYPHIISILTGHVREQTRRAASKRTSRMRSVLLAVAALAVAEAFAPMCPTPVMTPSCVSGSNCSLCSFTLPARVAPRRCTSSCNVAGAVRRREDCAGAQGIPMGGEVDRDERGPCPMRLSGQKELCTSCRAAKLLMRFLLSMGVLNRQRQRTEHYSACTALRCGTYTLFGGECLGLAVVKPRLIQVCLQGAATRRAGLTGLQMAHHVNDKGAKEVCLISLPPPPSRCFSPPRPQRDATGFRKRFNSAGANVSRFIWNMFHGERRIEQISSFLFQASGSIISNLNKPAVQIMNQFESACCSVNSPPCRLLARALARAEEVSNLRAKTTFCAKWCSPTYECSQPLQCCVQNSKVLSRGVKVVLTW